jgi:hypothetical protein
MERHWRRGYLVTINTLSYLVQDFRNKRASCDYERTNASIDALADAKWALEDAMVEQFNVLHQAASNSFSWDSFQTDRDTARNTDLVVMTAISDLCGVIHLVLDGEL